MLKVAMCSTEAVPFAKTGGLADVVGALPHYYKSVGMDTIVIMPGYNFIFSKYQNVEKISENVSININKDYKESFDIYRCKYNNVDFYFIKNDKFFNRENLYGTSSGDYEDNNLRFGFLSKAILELLKKLDIKVDIIHLHDYHVALTSLLVYDLQKKQVDDFFKNTKTVFTIHNLAYQGIYDKSTLDLLGISKEYFNINGLEFYGKVNFMKGGIIYSKKITTVSPTYSKEILTQEFGYGLEDVLKSRENDLLGIINGIDYNIWDPGKDKVIKQNYNIDDYSGKKVCKKYLLNCLFENSDFTKPVLGMVSRLSEQKGIDLIVEAFDFLMNEDLYLVILGTGDERYIKILENLKKKYKEKFSINITFSDKLARDIYSGSDIFLMPSKYEPCGLGQLISLKYGTIPVVRNTGGLADTVVDINSPDDIRNGGQGFKFLNYKYEELFKTIKRAIYYFNQKDLWDMIIKNAMSCDFSWDYSARKYKELFTSLFSN